MTIARYLTEHLAIPHPGLMTSTTTETLEREIRSKRNVVVNGLVNRRSHPTFGYTKTSLRADLHRLEGLIIAHRIVTGASPGNPGVRINDYAKDRLGVDLDALGKEIAES